MSLFQKNFIVARTFDEHANAVVALGDSLEFAKTLPSNYCRLIISSPPYNIGKAYEKQVPIADYLKQIEPLLGELVRLLASDNSFCWQVGNHVDDGEIYPLDMFFYHQFKKLGLRLRNRIIWHFDHGLHASAK